MSEMRMTVRDPSPKSLERFVNTICKEHVGRRPAILRILENMYLPEKRQEQEDSQVSSSAHVNEQLDSKITGNAGSIMKEKLMKYQTTQEVMSALDSRDEAMITSDEISHISNLTLKQWKCKDWYVQKAGIISASKAKRVHSAQSSLESCPHKDVSKLVNEIANPNVPSCIPSLPDHPQNPRD